MPFRYMERELEGNGWSLSLLSLCCMIELHLCMALRWCVANLYEYQWDMRFSHEGQDAHEMH